MLARERLNRSLIALWCLAAAASCARVTVESPQDSTAAAQAAETRTPAELESQPPVQTPEPAADASLPTVASNAPGAAEPPAKAEPPALSLAEVPQPVEPSAAVAAPASEDPEAELVTAPVASPDAELDVATLLTRLRKTKAINLRTKLAVKHESDDLLERLRAYHAHDGTATLAELRRSYDSLVRKLLSLLEDEDPPLARDIDRSRAAIWAILADPLKFDASARSGAKEPRA